MKVVILAGGYGTRIMEETEARPKPMIEIGGKPILWHIMKIYSSFGINDFIICCGYRGYMIKEYFANYFLHTADVTINLDSNSMHVHEQHAEPWKVTLVDTGQDTMTGGRIRRIARYVEEENAFCLTYGDGLANVNIEELIKFHFKSGASATMTAVKPPGRFGVVQFDRDHTVSSFNEKPAGDGHFINGGFFVLTPSVIDLIDGDQTVWEEGPLSILATRKELKAFCHDGFWHPMDAMRDRIYLESLWRSGTAPWKNWQ